MVIFRALLEALPAAVPPFALEADFRGEAFEGDSLATRADEADGAKRVALVRESDGREIARAVFHPAA